MGDFRLNQAFPVPSFVADALGLRAPKTWVVTLLSEEASEAIKNDRFSQKYVIEDD